MESKSKAQHGAPVLEGDVTQQESRYPDLFITQRIDRNGLVTMKESAESAQEKRTKIKSRTPLPEDGDQNQGPASDDRSV